MSTDILLDLQFKLLRTCCFGEISYIKRRNVFTQFFTKIIGSQTFMASHDRKRLFGVQHAPVFRPTVEEFADPLAYIKSIRHIGLQTGIVKIVPPNTFKPPFCIDKEKFTFKTRLQQLNTLEATTRNANNYAEGLKLFHEQFGTKKFQLPVLDGNSVNLLRLKNTATLLQNVDQQIDWTIVTEALNLNQKSDHRLRKIYENYIIPYEKALKDVQSKPADTRNDETSTCSTVTISSDEESDQVSIKDKGKKPFKRIKFDVIMSKTPEFVKKDTFANPQATMKRASPKIGVVINSNCKVCQKQGYCKDSTVCAQCGSQFHLESVSSNTNAISSNSWTCVTCIKTMGADFGFEEFHQKRGWNEFKTVANRFKLDWCLSRNLKGGCRQTIEKEFWRLVGSIEEKVVVEYGADLHAIDVGSGFPNKASMPNDPYRHNPWNLNNFPTLAGSLFKASANVISGMMVPWVYIGMVFSAFAWHAEDHYTYSINYNHTGAAKTWYGIPESDADKFETTIKNLVPELFESNPDLLFQLTTILSPQTLVDNGVQVFGADQGAGEFIVTFPRGYHSGFNQGFNCAEAVNFAPTDWISIGFECVLNYSKYLKAPVFCHEELLINAALECRDKYDALM